MTEIPTGEGKLYLATVIDLYSRRLLACPISEHPNAELAANAIKIAAAVRGGRERIDGVIFHTDRGSTYTAGEFTILCRDRLGIRQSMGRVGSCFDNAAAESFFSTLEHEVLSRHSFATKARAREVIKTWCHEFYNTRRRHSSAALLPPAAFETVTADQPAAA
jgi:putative transposase